MSESKEISFEHLTSEEYHVLREAGTESPYSNDFIEVKDGIFVCKACGNNLFKAEDKFDSGTGWPSFDQPITPDAVEYKTDRKLFMSRTEVLCGNCHSHLGHVFNDGPTQTGKRFCMNGIAMKVDK